jgi:hypothetical protein
MDDLSGQPVPENDIPDMSGQPVPAEDMPESSTASGQSVPLHDLPEEIKQQQYGTTGQQALAVAEGAAQGLLGPLAPLAETKLFGVKPEDIAGRAEANPVTHGVSEAATLIGTGLMGAGEAALISKAADLANFTRLGKVGSMALKGAVEAGALQGSDEASKAILGQQDPQEPVASALANAGYSMLLGGVTGGIFGVIGASTNKGLQYIEDQKLSKKTQSFLSGVGAAKEGLPPPKYDPFLKQYVGAQGEIDKTAYQAGMDFHENMAEKISNFAIDKASELAGGVAGAKAEGLIGAYGGFRLAKFMEPYLEKILKKPLTKASEKFVVPMVTKVLTSNTASNVGQVLDYATKCDKGFRKINNGLDYIFRTGGQQAFNAGVSEIQKEKIDDFIENNKLDKEIQEQKTEQPQNFAKGGEIMSRQENKFSDLFPKQNLLLQTARGRVYSYLKSLRPSNISPGLPYDKKEPSAEHKRIYNNALDMATDPLSIIKHIKDGTITQEHVSHMRQMWPELHDHLSKKITERIVRQQINDETPNYRTRQSLSVFMRSPLESTFTPMNIVAAQSIYAPKTSQQPASGQPKMKRGTAKLGNKTNNLYQTSDQEGERDRSDRN